MPTISQDVMTVLSAAEISGSCLKLTGKLDRNLYVETNKVLDAAGGKWNRSAGAHVFDGDAAEAIEQILLTGEYSRTKQDFGQFDTPPELADRLVEMARIEPGMLVLEPSAGIGNIAIPAAKKGANVVCYEIDQKRVDRLSQANIDAGRVIAQIFTVEDFLDESSDWSYDRVVMNPPFAKQADIDHVLHAYRFLKPGGLLVAIMSAGVTFREDRKTRDFRNFVEKLGGTIEGLPAGSFKSSGTMVNACIVTMPH